MSACGSSCTRTWARSTESGACSAPPLGASWRFAHAASIPAARYAPCLNHFDNARVGSSQVRGVKRVGWPTHQQRDQWSGTAWSFFLAGVVSAVRRRTGFDTVLKADRERLHGKLAGAKPSFLNLVDHSFANLDCRGSVRRHQLGVLGCVTPQIAPGTPRPCRFAACIARPRPADTRQARSR